MPFNEKSAWIMSLALFVGGIGYFGTVLWLSGDAGVLAAPSLPAVGVYTVTLIVVAIVFASLMLARIAEYALRIYYYRTSI